MSNCIINDKCSANKSHVRDGARYCNRHYLQVLRHGQIRLTSRESRPAVLDGDIAKIPLGVGAKDGYAIVDKKYAYLADSNWRMTHWGYVCRSVDHKLLHRVITEARRGKVVDHINGDPLDNRVKNLRICTQSLNSKNQKLRKNNRTGFKGVSVRRGKFVAKIKSDYKTYWLGTFKTLEEAAHAYSEAAKKYHGEFARLT